MRGRHTASEIRSAAHSGAGHSGPMNERGLDRDGAIAREGALDRVPAAFVPVVEAARARITERFGRTHLDLQPALHDEPTEADRADAKAIEAVLDRALPQMVQTSQNDCPVTAPQSCWRERQTVTSPACFHAGAAMQPKPPRTPIAGRSVVSSAVASSAQDSP